MARIKPDGVPLWWWRWATRTSRFPGTHPFAVYKKRLAAKLLAQDRLAVGAEHYPVSQEHHTAQARWHADKGVRVVNPMARPPRGRYAPLGDIGAAQAQRQTHVQHLVGSHMASQLTSGSSWHAQAAARAPPSKPAQAAPARACIPCANCHDAPANRAWWVKGVGAYCTPCAKTHGVWRNRGGGTSGYKKAE